MTECLPLLSRIGGMVCHVLHLIWDRTQFFFYSNTINTQVLKSTELKFPLLSDSYYSASKIFAIKGPCQYYFKNTKEKKTHWLKLQVSSKCKNCIWIGKVRVEMDFITRIGKHSSILKGNVM